MVMSRLMMAKKKVRGIDDHFVVGVDVPVWCLWMSLILMLKTVMLVLLPPTSWIFAEHGETDLHPRNFIIKDVSPVLIIQAYISTWFYIVCPSSLDTCIYHLPPKTKMIQTLTSWWFQPLWKICSSNWVHLPQIGVNIKNLWNHHPKLKKLIQNESDVSCPQQHTPHLASYTAWCFHDVNFTGVWPWSAWGSKQTLWSNGCISTTT